MFRGGGGGGLNIEKALWNAFVDLLHCSVWMNVLSEAGLAMAGTANFLKAAYLTRRRHIHQQTAVTLACFNRTLLCGAKKRILRNELNP